MAEWSSCSRRSKNGASSPGGGPHHLLPHYSRRRRENIAHVPQDLHFAAPASGHTPRNWSQITRNGQDWANVGLKWPESAGPGWLANVGQLRRWRGSQGATRLMSLKRTQIHNAKLVPRNICETTLLNNARQLPPRIKVGFPINGLGAIVKGHLMSTILALKGIRPMYKTRLTERSGQGRR